MYSEYDLLAEGFPHSEISGSTIARISPKLIAACHVLHRLLAPRHPPSALNSLSPTTRTPARRTINQPFPLSFTPFGLRLGRSQLSHWYSLPHESLMQQALIDAQRYNRYKATNPCRLATFLIHTNQSRFTCQNSSPAPDQHPSEVSDQAGKQGFSWRSRSIGRV